MAGRRQALPGAGSPGSPGAKPTPASFDGTQDRLRQAQDHPSKEGIKEPTPALRATPPRRGADYPLLGGKEETYPPTDRRCWTRFLFVPRQRRGGFPRAVGWVFRAARQFLRNTRGAAVLESAIGAVVLVTTSTLAFDLYTRATTTATGLNVAVTVADYVSLEKAPKASEMTALAKFLHGEFFPQADAAFVVTAVQGTDDQNQKWTWSKQILVDADASPDPDLATCSQVAGADNKATLPAALALKANEIVVVAEVCVKHAGGVSYYHHILPPRSENAPVLQS